MIKNKYFWTLVILLMPMAMALNSCCLHDDLDKCYTNQIALSYQADGNTEVLPQYIKTVQLFIYEANTGVLVEQQELDTNDASNPTPMIKFYLKTGTRYKIIAIGNVGDKTELQGIDSNAGEQIRFGTSEAFKSPLSGSNDHLYLGTTLIEGREAFTKEIDYVRMNAVHYNLFVALDKESMIMNDQKYQLHIGSVPAICDGDGMMVNDKKATYTFDIDKDNPKYLVQHGALLRFDPSAVDDITVELVETVSNTTLHRLNLGDYLRKKTASIDLTKQEVDITFYYYRPNMVIEVSPWSEVDVKPIL